MSSVCGSASTSVLRTSYNQLTGTQRTLLEATALTYSQAQASATHKFKSSSELLAYRTGKILAQSTDGPGPTPSVIISNLQAAYQESLLQTYNAAYDILGSPMTTVTNSDGEGSLNGVFWQVSDTSSSLWTYLPAITNVSQITSITLMFYSGYNQSSSFISDAIFCVARDAIDPSGSSVILFNARQQRIEPTQAGDIYAIGSPELGLNTPIIYANEPMTISDQSLLRAIFGGGTDTVDRTRGFQFYWFCSTEDTLINNSQINQFAINYTYSAVCPTAPYAIPDPPLMVQGTSGDASITVTWLPPTVTGGSPILYYTVTATPEGGGTSVSLRGFSPLVLEGLINGTPYTISVTASAGGGTSTAATTMGTVTPYVRPTPPRNIVAVRGNTQVSLTWDIPLDDGGSPITGYIITWTGGTTTVTGTSATITGLINGNTYIFSIKSVTIRTVSFPALSNPVIPATVPNPPTTINGIIGDRLVTLTWLAPAQNGGSAVIDYKIRVYQAGVFVSLITATGLSATVTGLTNGLPYVFTITARNDVGESVIATSPTLIPYTVPDAPTGITAALVDIGEQVRVSWTPASNGGSALLSYTVTSVPAGVSVTVSAPATSAIITGLSEQTNYQFYVVARNVAGYSTQSVLSNTVRLDEPTAPTGVVAVLVGADGQVRVSWSASNGRGLSLLSYIVTSFPAGVSVVVGPTELTTVVSGLLNQTNYQFRVVATNAVGPSTPSAYSSSVRLDVPSPPLLPTAVAGDTTAVVSWTTPAANGGFAITSYTVKSNPGNIETTVYAPTLTATVTGLTNGTAYTFTVKAMNQVGDSLPSAATSPAVVPEARPTPPTQVTAAFDSTNNPGSIFLTWTPPLFSVVLNYTITDGTRTYTTVSPSLRIDGLPMPAAYTYTVTATSRAGTSDPSTPSAPILLGPPRPPTAIQAFPGNTQATINWTLPVTDGGYPILYYTVISYLGIGGPANITRSVFEPAATSITMTGLTNGITYVFRVLAGNEFYASVLSDYSVTVTPSAPAVPPTNVIATPGYLEATVSWTPPVSSGGYVIRNYLINTYPGGPPIKVVSGTTTSTLITGLALSTNYYFTVVMRTLQPIELESLPSNTIVSLIAPSKPAPPTAVRGAGKATVSWTAPYDGGSPITGYTVTSIPGSFTATTTGATTVDVTGLTNGTPYTFTVIARNQWGSSLPSDPSVVPVIPARAPDAPAKPTAVKGNGQATVSWTAPYDGGDGITGYTVTSSPGSFTATTTGALSAIVTGLANGTPYTFTVVATNTVSSSPASPASDPVTPSTVPATPAAPTAVRGPGQATVSWTAPFNGGATITSYTATSIPGGFTATTTTGLSVVVTGLTNGTSYTFTVIATNINGPSLASSPSAAVIPAAAPATPAAPTALNTYSGSTFTGVTVKWVPPANNGSPITNYYVYTYDLVGLFYIVPYLDLSGAAIVPVGGFVTTTIGNVVLGRSYVFYLSATNAAGTSIASPISNTIVPAAGPLPPTGILYTNYSNGFNTPLVINGVTYYDSVVLTWIASVSNGSPITSYLIRSSNNGAYIGATPVTAVTPDQNNRIYQTVRFLPLGGNCTFTIDATNALDTSTQAAFATPIKIMNVPVAPAAPTWFPPSSGYINVSFILNNSNGSPTLGYTISAYLSNGTYISSVSGDTPNYPDGFVIVRGFTLTSGRTYNFRAQIRNAVGPSPVSAPSANVYLP